MAAANGGGETMRKLIVEVIEARDLLPKDGVGTCSPYVMVDFNGQRKRTQTVHRTLNPTWNESLEFDASGLQLYLGAGEPLEVDVLHDKRVAPTRRNNFLGRLRLDSRQFVKVGEEALMHFPLQKKSFFGWVRGDLGLKVYYADVPVPVVEPPQPPEEGKENVKEVVCHQDDKATTTDAQPLLPPEEGKEKVEEVVCHQDDKATTTDAQPPPEAEVPSAGDKDEGGSGEEPKLVEGEATLAADVNEGGETVGQPPVPPPIEEPQNVLRQMTVARPTDRRPEMPVERSKFDLVEKMQYLFVRIVRARSLPQGAKPHVRISISGRTISTQLGRKAMFFEWDETFSFTRQDSIIAIAESSSLEISIWDLPPESDIATTDIGNEHFLGGICFDTSEIPIRDPPDSPLAAQWYRMEGGAARRGDLMLATWIGTQEDDCFNTATKVDDHSLSGHASTWSKVYLSPKLWYLRLTVIEAQDLTTSTVAQLATPLSSSRDYPVSVKVNLGFQAVRTRFASSRNGSPSWGEDLLLVAAEPFGDQKVMLTLEARQSNKDQMSTPSMVVSASISLSSIERRVDDRQVTSRWLALDPPAEEKDNTGTRPYGAGRLHVRACFDGGYHVTDEPAYAASDYRPSARQLWKQPIGTIELGIIGCKGLLPMKTMNGKGSTDAYVVAKYGPKWARTRTAVGSLEPAWNEQYTWPVYDPSTVLTVGVFDDGNDRQSETSSNKGVASSRPIGRIRIRISSLENGKAYRSLHPLLLLLPSSVKRMGEIELAVRFSKSITTVDLVHLYGKPMLPLMHHLRPIASPLREPLRYATSRIIASHLSRSDPPLRKEAVMHMLDEMPQRYSMRKVRSNWHRIASSFSWAVEIVRWAEDTRSWRNPTGTLLAHGVLVLLVCYPDLIVPALTLHIAVVGIWKYRRRPRGPARQPWEMVTAVDNIGSTLADDIDEEMDTVPSTKSYEVVRARYDRLRAVAGRLQGLLRDVAAHGERIQALVTWRDPRATGLLVVVCLFISVVLYVVPSKIMAVGLGFYYLRHPMFRDRMPPAALNFFRRLPSLSHQFL